MSTKRTYILGDEWLYYKIYCGARTSDVLLTETIKPLTSQLLEKGLIDSWFFIRYGDPDFHIRIRFHLPDIHAIGTVILHINAVMQRYIEQRVVYKLQTDTYIRELERYGTNTIDASETLFFYDSTMLLDAIALIEDEELYFLFVVKAIDRLLNSFNYEQQEKLKLVTRNSKGFKREFHADKGLNKQLDKKYRGLKSKLASFLETTSIQEDYGVLDDLLDHKAKQSLGVVQNIMKVHQDGQLEMSLDDLLSSYIHMLVNRAFRSKQRFYELVCYDFLMRYQKTKASYNLHQ
ncbi:thiopeptide-type bacteriocin biosynthesis protein [Aquimarina sp. MAR_2010_214]|uniref:thiopeptide-type bacteriocin biosynthesis protein n=1 Tax=Aquimarina sp. MAR_2010_214 TaxID=1250026 RepID=UPI000C705656|nr:thiopeptide-type bacteriocin biosynthesis protein [Aquimarina sp. MAR_2010_214]PKV48448.1 thiopeptide-type bacteriocin biosynthesis protein [Aquimarina sp. MAR_2010_214]